MAELTLDEAADALRAGAWSETVGLDAAAPCLLAAVDALWDLCHDDAGNWLPDSTGVPVRDLAAVLRDVGEMPKHRMVVHCRLGGMGADWGLPAALDLVASARSVDWSRGLFGHDLVVVGEDGKQYRFDVRKPGEET